MCFYFSFLFLQAFVSSRSMGSGSHVECATPPQILRRNPHRPPPPSPAPASITNPTPSSSPTKSTQPGGSSNRAMTPSGRPSICGSGRRMTRANGSLVITMEVQVGEVVESEDAGKECDGSERLPYRSGTLHAWNKVCVFVNDLGVF